MGPRRLRAHGHLRRRVFDDSYSFREVCARDDPGTARMNFIFKQNQSDFCLLWSEFGHFYAGAAQNVHHLGVLDDHPRHREFRRNPRRARAPANRTSQDPQGQHDPLEWRAHHPGRGTRRHLGRPRRYEVRREWSQRRYCTAYCNIYIPSFHLELSGHICERVRCQCGVRLPRGMHAILPERKDRRQQLNTDLSQFWSGGLLPQRVVF